MLRGTSGQMAGKIRDTGAIVRLAITAKKRSSQISVGVCKIAETQLQALRRMAPAQLAGQGIKAQFFAEQVRHLQSGLLRHHMQCAAFLVAVNVAAESGKTRPAALALQREFIEAAAYRI